MPIADAYTDQAPAAAVFEGRLYVAFKTRGSDGIRLASTRTPEDPASWHVSDLTMHFSEPGPVQIRTQLGPALSVDASHLWLAFTGHNNPRIWLMSMDANMGWRGHGPVPNAFTSNEPALAGPFLVHRGQTEDNRVHCGSCQVE